MDIILSAALVFVSTSIDYLFILTILFATQGKQHRKSVYFGQYLGTGILVAVSLIAAFFLNLIPQEWVIGLLGLIPIALGIRAVLVDEDVDEDEIEEQLSKKGSTILAFAGLTLAMGGDNVGIYVPYFTGKTFAQILIVIAVFALGILGLCVLSQRLASVPAIGETVEKYERIIVPIVFIGLGIYILVENGTFAYLWTLNALPAIIPGTI